MRNAKDTAHTKAERSILEGVKVLMPSTLSVPVWKDCLELLIRFIPAITVSNSASIALTVISALQHMATSLFENAPALYSQIIRYGRSEAIERTAIKIMYFNLQGHIPETSENSLF